MTEHDVRKVIHNSYQDMDLGEDIHHVDLREVTRTGVVVAHVTLNIGPPVRGTILMDVKWIQAVLEHMDN